MQLCQLRGIAANILSGKRGVVSLAAASANIANMAGYSPSVPHLRLAVLYQPPSRVIGQHDDAGDPARFMLAINAERLRRRTGRAQCLRDDPRGPQGKVCELFWRHSRGQPGAEIILVHHFASSAWFDPENARALRRAHKPVATYRVRAVWRFRCSAN